MKKFFVLVVVLCAVSSTAAAAAATRGCGALYDKSSYKVIIATQMGFTCGKIMGVSVWLNRGDEVVGELESFGMHEIYNLTDDESFSLWIDKYWANQDQALDWLERGY